MPQPQAVLTPQAFDPSLSTGTPRVVNDRREAYWATAAVLSAGALALVWHFAWFAQDAFIAFRYVANLWSGHGLVWNAGERVQGCTCALWTLLLCLAPKEFTCYWALLLGMITTAITLIAVAVLFARTRRPILGLLVFFCAFFSSKSILEWSTAGMENSLNHALLAILYAAALVGTPGRRRDRVALIAAGLLMFNRLDQLLVVGPVLLYLAVTALHRREFVAYGRSAIIAFTPLALWLIFATIYYGYPLPNTSYAKLGVPLRAQVTNGLLCLKDFITCEPWHAAMVFVVCFIAIPLFVRRRGPGAIVLACLALSVALQIVYFIGVGGDYMRGRFLTGDLLLASLAAGYMVAVAPSPMRRGMIWSLATAAVLLPLGIWQTVNEPIFDGVSGVVRIMDYYHPFTEIRTHLKAWRFSELRAEIRRVHMDLDQLAQLNQRAGTDAAMTYGNLGESTYAAIDTPLIDPSGLTDAFIARTRPGAVNRPGHVQRDTPTAYLVSRGCVDQQPGWQRRLAEGDLTLVRDAVAQRDKAKWLHPEAVQVARELAILTRGPIFSRERFALILKYTFGHPIPYDKHDRGPLIYAEEVPPTMLNLSSDLSPALTLLGISPSDASLVGPRQSNCFWLAPTPTAPLAIHVKCAKPQDVYLTFLAREFGYALPVEQDCPVQVSVRGVPQAEFHVRRLGMYLVPLRLPAGVSIITLDVPVAPGSERFFLDSRPLMLYVGNMKLADEPDAAQQIVDLHMRMGEVEGAQPIWYAPADPPSPNDQVGAPPLLQTAGVTSDHAELVAIEPAALAGGYESYRGGPVIWLGPQEAGQIALLVQSDQSIDAKLSGQVEALGAAAPPAGCPLRVLVNGAPLYNGTAAARTTIAAGIHLNPGLNRVTFRVDAEPSPGRFGLDLRPLMLLLSHLQLSPR
ncbi:MAG TPA: hypothetical protein VLI90_01600 [Tepidisphaeraceae bacterium]|nr:hypothetical protein [Tepidisphaeraceae bacterium]